MALRRSTVRSRHAPPTKSASWTRRAGGESPLANAWRMEFRALGSLARPANAHSRGGFQHAKEIRVSRVARDGERAPQLEHAVLAAANALDDPGGGVANPLLGADQRGRAPEVRSCDCREDAVAPPSRSTCGAPASSPCP